MIENIENIWEREFGFVFPRSEGSKETFMRRYVSFATQKELEKDIKMNKPLDCYVSVAFYKYPQNMEGWLRAELFFDFDYNENTKLAYVDALTTYEVLLSDFGLENISIRFSGSKGYHVIVHDFTPQILGTKERRAIVDYLIGKYKIETLDMAASCDVKRLRRIAGTKNSKSRKLCETVKRSRELWKRKK